LDAVGPSKFIRYKGMTGLTISEPILLWTDVSRNPSWRNGSSVSKIIHGSVWVRQRVDQLLGHYGKTIGSAAKLSAPRGWSLDKQVIRPHPRVCRDSDQAGIANSVLDGIWHAFINLSPEDQRDLAARIIKYTR